MFHWRDAKQENGFIGFLGPIYRIVVYIFRAQRTKRKNSVWKKLQEGRAAHEFGLYATVQPKGKCDSELVHFDIFFVMLW